MNPKASKLYNRHRKKFLFLLLITLIGEIVTISENTNTHNNNNKVNINAQFPLLMPNITLNTQEVYLCTSVKIETTQSYYITGYEPNASMNTAHHMLLYGCAKPGTVDSLWNCGEMAHTTSQRNEKTALPCHANYDSQILYAWARNAPKLALPHGVGFKVGKNSPVKYMVLQVHYTGDAKFADGKHIDDSGVILNYTTVTLSKLAGVIFLGTSGYIPPMAIEHMETHCDMRENKTIYPIAYRTHAHGLCTVAAGYRVRTNERGAQYWTQLGKRNPLTPQMFYPVDNLEPILFGDRIAVRCTMISNRTSITEIGSTNDDEMCNYYVMYYVIDDEPLQMKYCFSRGPPLYYWQKPEVGFTNIPDYEASHL